MHPRSGAREATSHGRRQQEGKAQTGQFSSSSTRVKHERNLPHIAVQVHDL